MDSSTWKRDGPEPSDWWIEAFAYPSMSKAGRAYEKCTAVLRRERRADASVYRIQLNGRPFLVMVGRGEPLELYHLEMRILCGVEETTPLPLEVELALLERSAKMYEERVGFIERRNVNEVVE